MPSKWLSLLKGQKSVNYVLRGITFQYSFFLLLFFISFQSIFLPLFTSNSQPLRCFSDSLYLLIHLDSLSLSLHIQLSTYSPLLFQCSYVKIVAFYRLHLSIYLAIHFSILTSLYSGYIFLLILIHLCC